MVREYPQFIQLFEQILLKGQSQREQVQILRQSLARLNHHQILVPTTVIEKIVSYTEQFPILGQAPRAALSLLDEALGAAAARKMRELTLPLLEEVVASKTGVPKKRLAKHAAQEVLTLEQALSGAIVGQEGALKRLIAALRRAKLGMRSPQRPLGSFLMLGPSGVGKTETAKVVAEALYGRSESFIRFDMSEFSQEHTVQRLIGAPAGYVGHETGGALTTAIKREPYSLILLDEIEKAHPKVFDIFLQILDDGRITSGQNETIDARNTIIIATSNSGVHEILATVSAGLDPNAPEIQAQRIFPALEQHFRVEFLNRFDAVLAFEPLSIEALTAIAHLEMRKVERRLAEHGAAFAIDPAVLKDHIQRVADPRFGARPVKRFIEDLCESVLVEKLMKKAVPNGRERQSHTVA
jgi:ATP-dependent Clp protease ATP-binding subunit ClpB